MSSATAWLRRLYDVSWTRHEQPTGRVVGEHVAGGRGVVSDRESAGQHSDFPDADARPAGAGAHETGADHRGERPGADGRVDFHWHARTGVFRDFAAGGASGRWA